MIYGIFKNVPRILEENYFLDKRPFQSCNNVTKIVQCNLNNQYRIKFVVKTMKYGRYLMLLWRARDPFKWLFLNYEPECVFVHENSLCHKSRHTLSYFAKKVCLLSDWPPHSRTSILLKIYD